MEKSVDQTSNKPTSNQDPEIQFKPITKGLGFHPFSDGLPYAPITKTKAPISQPLPPMGTGAMAAGPVRIAREIPRIRLPQPTPSLPPRREVNPALDREMPKPMPTTPLRGSQMADANFAYLIKRSTAYVLDTALNLSLCGGALYFVMKSQGMSLDLIFNAGVILILSTFLFVFNWALIAAQEIAFGTTIAKRSFGLILDASASSLFLRAFFFIPSFGFCGLGLVWALFDPEKRCWHDLVMGVKPTSIRKIEL